MSILPPLRLAKHHDRRLRAGHLWVYSNEVAVEQTPLTAFEPGQAVTVETYDGKILGNAYVNPQSLICARLFSRDPRYHLDRSLLTHRLNIALSLRQRLFDQPYYRLVYGEGDNLPGLIIDRFGEVLVAQLTTAGMERAREEVIAALQKLFTPAAIVLRNDSPIREIEGLNAYKEVAAGALPDEVLLTENGLRFRVPVLNGQKTGWFYDHRLNRQRMTQYVKGLHVLDVFSYSGAWGIQAAAAGARAVCLDSSAAALTEMDYNAALNGLSISKYQGDAFETLKTLRENGEKFDAVILDPPAFIKRKKDQASGEAAYRRLNQLAMQVLTKEGWLVSASCSMHLARETLQDLILAAARHLGKTAQIIEQGHQSPDHPIHPAIPETNYLKCFIVRVLPA